MTQLFTDFVFADFLVTYTPYVSKVVFQWVATYDEVDINTPYNYLTTPAPK